MSNVKYLAQYKAAPKSKSSSMETLILKRHEVENWVLPPFQRGLRVNAKVKELCESLNGGEYALDGVLTLGRLSGDSRTYIVDGQHRIEAFRLSSLEEVIADVRIMQFEDMGEMAEEFVRLNSALVRMRSDDILRGLESSTPVLKEIRDACPFVGYDNIRRNTMSGPVVSMSSVLRCWVGSGFDTPVLAKVPGNKITEVLGGAEVQCLIDFLQTAYSAWGRDPEYARMWSSLNLCLCMWLWRQIVANKPKGTARHVHIQAHAFRSCLMALSADPTYSQWLVGRIVADRDRNPCYQRIKAIFARRLMVDGVSGKKPKFPLPAWANS